VVNPEPLCSRPRTENVWVRAPQAESGLRRTTIELRSAFEPSCVVSVAGLALPSQYVVTLSSLALVATKVCTNPDAVIGLPRARLLPGPELPFRVTVSLFADWLPAASFARTKYETDVLAGWLSV
jgi:hypothetical protein